MTIREEQSITLPEELRQPVAKAVAEWQSPLMFSLSEQLQDMGVPTHVSVQIEINTLMTWACRLGVMCARVIERREPNAEWWRLACEDEYRRTMLWFQETFPDADDIARLATEAEGTVQS